MSEGDLERVLEIERLSFPSPWTHALFVREISNPLSRIVVARDDTGDIVGYICYWLVGDEVDIHNIAVHPASRRKGVGGRLLTRLIDEAKGRGAVRILLEVRSGNLSAIAFYVKHGFVKNGLRKGYYSDTGEDAVLMEFCLGGRPI